MDTTTLSVTDLEAIARQLQLQPHQCRVTVELLDEGNTVPFITRYRKDRTDGLDEEKIRQIQEAVELRRQVNDRRERILRSIQSQGALTPELEQRIHAANSLKILEDLYLPYRPKKQTLATTARERGLEPLAQEILNGDPAADDLDARCPQFIDPEKELPGGAEVLAGARHIVAEILSERGDLRSLARRHLWGGNIVSKRIEQESEEDSAANEDDALAEDSRNPAGQEPEVPEATESVASPVDEAEAAASSGGADASDEKHAALPTEELAGSAPPSVPETPSDVTGPDSHEEASTPPGEATGETAAMGDARSPSPADSSSQPTTEEEAADSQRAAVAPDATAADSAEPVSTETEAASTSDEPVKSSGSLQPKGKLAARGPLASKTARLSLAEDRRRARREARHRKRQKLEQSFKDYFDYSEPLKKLPHYRVLALNRGERCKVLRVRIQFDFDSLKQAAEQLVIPEGHRHAELLRSVLQDALTRLVVPSIEREIRRELTERAEHHAVKVFAQNLRKLLLQPPLCGHRVLAVDPGFRSGCKLAVLDEFGNLLDHSLIHVIGPADRVQQSMQKLGELIQQHKIDVIALGNGTACRETEQFVAEVLAKHVVDREVHYLIVNEAGASVYSTSQVGREELPNCDATVRGAVSIGRRALDPLSELVKIDPASIGVGLYQHDVKGKHLRNSLDAVVESCVNYVGVDVNSASPALLRAVSGLNQLTARRIYEYRQQNGPFRCREQLRDVPGIGEATFVQAAGFLKISDGDNPLDATWIHPESYSVAQRVLEEIGCDVTQFVRRRRRPVVAATEAPAAPATDPVETPDASAPTASEAGTIPPEASAVEETAQSAAESDDFPDAQPVEIAIAESAESESRTSVDDSTQHGADRPEIHPPDETLPPPTPVEAHSSDPAEPSPAEPSATTSPDVPPPSTDEAAVVPEAASATAEEDAVDEAVDAGLLERLHGLDVPSLADKLSVGELLLKDILASLARPGRDPRDELPPPVFRREILKLEHLKAGMELCGTVLNVVDFGAFVDIGLSDSGLIHVSRLADRFVSDPHEVVSVGDVLNVWVVDVDEKRRRVSLTAIQPGTERARPPKQERRPRREPSGPPRKPRRDREREKTGKVTAKSRRASGGWQGKPKAKPVAPITEAMAEGREPMRTFSDLQQFFQRRQRKSDGPQSKEPPNKASDSD